MQGGEPDAKRALAANSDMKNPETGKADGVAVAEGAATTRTNINATARGKPDFTHLQGLELEEAQQVLVPEASNPVNAVHERATEQERDARADGIKENMQGEQLNTGRQARGNQQARAENELKEKKKKDQELRRMIRLATDPPISELLLATMTDFREMASDPRLNITENENRWQNLSNFYEDQNYEDYHKALQAKLNAGEPLTSDERAEAMKKIREGRGKLGIKAQLDENISDADLVKLLLETGQLIKEEANHHHDQMNAKIKIKEEFEIIADKLQAIYDDNETYPSDEAKKAAYEKVMDEAKNNAELQKAIGSLDNEGLKKEIRGILLGADSTTENQPHTTNETTAESKAEAIPIPGLDPDF